MRETAMAMTLQGYLIEQDAAVLDSFVDDGWCICAVTSVGELAALAGRHGRTVQRVGTLDPGEAQCVRHGAHAELWVRARRSDYSGPFLVFAYEVYGFASSGVPAGYNVDHLFNKERVQTPSGLQDDRLPVTTLVRMLLVDAPVNKSFGGLMESAMVGTGNPNRPYRRFTWLQLAKALSIHANLHGGGLGGTNRVTNIGHIVAEMDKRGVCQAFPISREQLFKELMQQSDTVNRFRAL
jgi:hypothetical protein